MMRIVSLFFAAILICSNAVAGVEEAAVGLEAKFVAAERFELFHRFQEVPEDVQSWFWSVATDRKIANYGELYSETDLILEGVPRAQHQFTAVTSRVSASLIKLGGFVRQHMLILVDRERSDLACAYRVKWETQFVETLQYGIANKREVWRDFFEGHPVCKALKKRS